MRRIDTKIGISSLIFLTDVDDGVPQLMTENSRAIDRRGGHNTENISVTVARE